MSVGVVSIEVVSEIVRVEIVSSEVVSPEVVRVRFAVVSAGGSSRSVRGQSVRDRRSDRFRAFRLTGHVR